MVLNLRTCLGLQWRAPQSTQADPEYFVDVSPELQKNGQTCLSCDLQTFIKLHRLGEDYPALENFSVRVSHLQVYITDREYNTYRNKLRVEKRPKKKL